ncbi:MAG: SAM-dependent methyltransferase [Prevotella sp.]|jgi:type I restriction enzyme M protein|nr:SAM-dependent methyltransferase [Prevotella sp.]MCI1474774.1 SAM-dependent methyltransferase [Prevotella sp.]
MILHSQFYTPTVISEILVNHIYYENPKLILDLGAGNGSLVHNAAKKWKEAECIAVDIDSKNCDILKKEFRYKVLNLDCLAKNIFRKLRIKANSVDVAVCNPPYISINNNDDYVKLLHKAKLNNLRIKNRVSSDVVFLAINLILLKPGGVLGIIVPYSIIAGKKFKGFRKSLLTNYYLENIFELPEKSFSYTEAKTGILIIRKEVPQNRKTKVSLVEHNQIQDTIYVVKENLIERMDYRYNKWISKRGSFTSDDHQVDIRRGKFSYRALKDLGVPYFHTTSFKDHINEFPYNYENLNGVACENTFLLARVGKRCVGKVLYIKSGRVLISDCIYDIRIPNRYVGFFLAYFDSDEYKEWVSVYAHGICSMVICKSDLEILINKKIDDFEHS